VSGLSDYNEKKALDMMFSAAAYPTIATHYIALYTALPNDANASGTEVTGGSYARVAVTNNATTWPVATGTAPTVKANGIVITYPAPTANWGTIVGMAVYDAASGGNELGWAPLATPQVVNNGAPAASFAIGILAITLD
jgi:hypothetical protein